MTKQQPDKDRVEDLIKRIDALLAPKPQATEIESLLTPLLMEYSRDELHAAANFYNHPQSNSGHVATVLFHLLR